MTTTLKADGKIQDASFSALATSALSGTVHLKGQFSDLGFLISTSDRYLGDVVGNIKLSGAIADPKFQGDLALQKGIFENAEYGTQIQNINLVFQLTGTTAKVSNCSASDYHKGTLRCAGELDFFKNTGHLSLDLSKFAIANSDAVTAMADASLKIGTTKEGVLLSGHAKVTRADFDLKDQQKDVKLIRVKEDKRVGEKFAIRREKSGLILDLAVDIDDKTYVHGYGLESYWSGTLAIKGDSAKPLVSGKLILKKGGISVGSKKMDLLEGALTFDGNKKLNPMIWMLAQKEIAGYVAVLKIEGKSDGPKIDLSSIPALPQDGVMSLILFGKPVTPTSSSQSLQLAIAMANLKGGGLGFGDKLVNAFGFDHLTVDQRDTGSSDDDPGGYKVRLGKQLTDRIYVALKQETGDDSGTGASLEIDVTNNTSLSVDVGTGKKSNGVSYNWEKRY